MIRINDDYVITVDELCYTLKQDAHRMSVDKKTGKESPVYYYIGYYATLENALKGYIRLMIDKRLGSGNYNIREALDVIREERENLEKLIEKYTGASE